MCLLCVGGVLMRRKTGAGQRGVPQKKKEKFVENYK
jgi:hypothetical protein